MNISFCGLVSGCYAVDARIFVSNNALSTAKNFTDNWGPLLLIVISSVYSFGVLSASDFWLYGVVRVNFILTVGRVTPR